MVSYLQPEEVDRSLRWMAASGASGSLLVFNYRAGFGAGTLDPEGLPDELRRAGFREVENQSFAEVHRRILGAESPEFADLFHIAVARN